MGPSNIYPMIYALVATFSTENVIYITNKAILDIFGN